MRYFFYLFLLILSVLSPKSSFLWGYSAYAQTPSNMDKFISFATDVSHKRSPFSESKGIGEWVDGKYAQIRLISSDSGTKDLKHLWMALEVKLTSGVKMKRPILSVKESKNVQDSRYFWPISLPLYPAEGLLYTYSTTFPLEITVQKENYPVSIQIALTADFCALECTQETILANLTIPAGPNYYTPYSSSIRRSLEFTPNIATENQLQFALLSSDLLWIKVNLPEKIENPSFLILNEENKKPIDYTLLHTMIKDNQGLFTLKTREKIDNSSLLIFMHAQNQMWQISGVASKKTIPPILSVSKSNKLPLYLWMFFMLMLPSFVLFIKQKPKHEIIAQKENFKNMIFVLIGTLCGTLIYWFYPYSVLINNYIWLIFCIFMFAILGYFSYPITAFGYGILNALVPFFSFFERAEVPIPTSFFELINFFAILSVIAVLPFLICIFKPIFSVRLGKSLNKNMPISFRFPMWLDMILFVYLFLMRLFG